MTTSFDNLKYDERGLIPAIVQDAHTREVLTLAYVNAESLRRTVEERETWFWSRSRNELWHKGATSGNIQRVVDIRPDCDKDAVLILVEPEGPACHTGARTCFSADVEEKDLREPRQPVEQIGETLVNLFQVITSRRAERPEGSYTTYLFEQGLDKILKKIGEEAAETIIAAKNTEEGPLVSETSDLIYHLLVLLSERGITLEQISAELQVRAGKKN
jgi:phosphoribosyl-ATP pyrophosphohydrolase/phosphoribosyl-AMP cyclohydrolase